MDVSGFCKEASQILQFVGYILTVFKIAIPLLIIAYGMFDFGKAVTASKDDEIKKSAKALGMRAVAGVIIFFIPTLVLWLFSAIGDYKNTKDSVDFGTCQNCILTPWKGCR